MNGVINHVIAEYDLTRSAIMGTGRPQIREVAEHFDLSEEFLNESLCCMWRSLSNRPNKVFDILKGSARSSKLLSATPGHAFLEAAFMALRMWSRASS